MLSIVDFVALAQQEIVISAASVLVAAFGVIGLIDAVLNRAPFLETALREDLVTQVPLAHVSGAVGGIVQQFRHGLHVGTELDIVVQASVLMRPSSGHDAGSRGSANRL